MKTIEINCYEVLSSDQEGWKYNHVAYVTTEKLAKILVSKKGKNWPHKYEKYRKTFKIYDSIEEVNK